MMKLITKTIFAPFIFVFSHNTLLAEVKTDGSMGLQVNIAAVNNEYQITESLGSREGDNLFHSFSTFNVEQNQRAIFSGSGDIKNIITRVSGNEASVINGAIQSSIDGANFWLLNPNGIVIGNGATFDISGSLNVTTADYIQFENQKIFPATNEQTTLTISSPKSFGFLAENNSPIVFDQAEITLKNSDFTLVSRSATFSDTSINLSNSNFSLIATNVDGELDPNSNQVMDFTADEFADVNLFNSQITSDTHPINIHSRKLDMVNSRIFEMSQQGTSQINIDADLINLTRSVTPYALNSVNNSNSENTSIDIQINEPEFDHQQQSPEAGLADTRQIYGSYLRSEEQGHEKNIIKIPTTNKTSCGKGSETGLLTLSQTMQGWSDISDFNPGPGFYQLDLNATRLSGKQSQQHFTDCGA